MSTSSLQGRNRLSPAEFTLLGMIALSTGSGGAIHGYDLSRQLTEGPIREVIRIEPGMLYHYLKKLASRDFISSTTETQEGRPDRRMHALTSRGQTMMDDWLAEPVQATREMRLDFLLKLWFARQLDPDRAKALIVAQRDVINSLMTSLETQLERVSGTSADDRFARKVIELRLAQNRAAATWLDTLEDDT